MAINSRTRFTIPLLAIALLAALALIVPQTAAPQQVSSNRLSLGPQAKVQSFVNLAINPPTEFDFKSRSEIENWRRNCAYQHSELLLYQYTPMQAIFGQIEDNKPWWGLDGQFFYDSGNRSIDGLSEESRYVNNPYMLVCANMVITGYLFENSKYPTKEDLANSQIPLECAPSQAVIYPRESRQEITYSVSNYLRACARIVDLPKQLGNAPFNLVAYNARDFGFNYIAVSPRYSRNINKTSDRPIEITQYFHCGNSCGYPGGCNNMSPGIDGLDGLTLQGVPAQACVYLWRNRPSSVEQQPDFMVTIKFI